MRRSPEVIDVWFDSGSMPYAQWHYPFEHEEEFEGHFPADFICEGLDQTRGWFYSLMAISTMLGRGPAFRNVVVNDLILDAEGQKMSKSKGNAVDPWDAVEAHGADAVRWYFITSSNPWVPKRYDPEGVGEAARKFFDTLFNTYRFFALYAGTEGWSPSESDPPVEERTALDRWLASRLASLVARVSEELELYEVTRAYREVADFLVEDLSNWYVRRSRPRFWGNTDEGDRNAAFRTLYDALRTVVLLVAPITPFTADWLHRALNGRSAHLEAFPDPEDASAGEEGDRAALERDMEAVRTLVSLGRSAREEVRIRVRQPLRTLHAVLPDGRELDGPLLDLVREELNVKEVSFLEDANQLVGLRAKPNFRALGPRFQSRSEAAATAIRELSSEDLLALRDGREVSIEVEGERHPLRDEELEIVEEARGDLVVRSEAGHTAALDPALDPELRQEGLARELVNRVQRLRRDAGLEITDRIRLGVFGPEELQAAVEVWRDFIGGETLALEVSAAPAPEEEGMGPFEATRDVDLDGLAAVIRLSAAGG
jgi:isoleucyl-tRNA synthetase